MMGIGIVAMHMRDRRVQMPMRVARPGYDRLVVFMVVVRIAVGSMLMFVKMSHCVMRMAMFVPFGQVQSQRQRPSTGLQRPVGA